MVHVIAMEVLPEERDRKYYADSYSCCPPPLFILLITIIEVRFYSIRIIIIIIIITLLHTLSFNESAFNFVQRHKTSSAAIQ